MCNVLFLSHTTDLIGPTEHFVNYLKKKKYRYSGLILPFHYSQEKKKIYIEGKLVKEINITINNQILSIFFDILIIFFFLSYLKIKKKKFDYCIGINPLNSFFIIIFKKFKLLNSKYVIHYTIDWVKKRFSSKTINFFYHNINYFCLTKADMNWVISRKICNLFKKLLSNKKIKIYHLPVGCIPNNVNYNKFLNLKSINVCYVGSFHHEKGIDTLIESIPEIIKKDNRFNFYFFGKTPNNYKLKNYNFNTYEEVLNNLNLKKHININFFNNLDKYFKGLSNMHFGFSVFEENNLSISKYSDPSKLKDYFSNNIIPVINEFNPLSSEIKKNNIGYIVKNSKQELISFFLNLKNEEIKTCSNNIIKYANENSWDSLFSNAFLETKA